eukprot:scaffold53820_cov34-Attheya_sp.AAC.1
MHPFGANIVQLVPWDCLLGAWYDYSCWSIKTTRLTIHQMLSRTAKTVTLSTRGKLIKDDDNNNNSGNICDGHPFVGFFQEIQISQLGHLGGPYKRKPGLPNVVCGAHFKIIPLSKQPMAPPFTKLITSIKHLTELSAIEVGDMGLHPCRTCLADA